MKLQEYRIVDYYDSTKSAVVDADSVVDVLLGWFPNCTLDMQAAAHKLSDAMRKNDPLDGYAAYCGFKIAPAY